MTDHLAFVLTLGYFTKGPELSWKQNTVSGNFMGQITAWADANSLSAAAMPVTPGHTLLLGAAYESSRGASGKTS